VGFLGTRWQRDWFLSSFGFLLSLLLLLYKDEKTCTLINVAISADRNVVQKEEEKKLKYKSLCIEIRYDECGT
jgi:hypothetical protein